MATKLEKDLVRESLTKFDDREIVVTLTKDQEISLKLKGMRTGSVSLSIEELYGQLTGQEVGVETNKGPITISNEQPKKGSKKNPMISLYDLRSHSAIADLDYADTAKFERIIKNLLDNLK